MSNTNGAIQRLTKQAIECADRAYELAMQVQGSGPGENIDSLNARIYALSQAGTTSAHVRNSLAVTALADSTAELKDLEFEREARHQRMRDAAGTTA